MSGVLATATRRLKQDYLRLQKDPVPFISAAPLPTNLLEWHYLVEGPPDSLYAGGFYHGKLIFPREFPFKPPSIFMITPNGRFSCNTRLCLSISDYHPESWNPAWCVSTILTGLLSFMLETNHTVGAIETSLVTKRQLASQSLEYNLRDAIVCELFPEQVEKMREKVRKQKEELARSQSPNSNTENSPAQAGNGNVNNFLTGALTNLLVLGGFAAFAYIVRFVLKEAV